MAQFSYTYITTGKTIALTIQTFIGKVMCLLFNMLSWFVIAFLPRSKSILISWLQSPSTVILDPKKIKSVTVATVSPSICHEVMRFCEGPALLQARLCAAHFGAQGRKRRRPGLAVGALGGRASPDAAPSSQDEALSRYSVSGEVPR